MSETTGAVRVPGPGWRRWAAVPGTRLVAALSPRAWLRLLAWLLRRLHPAALIAVLEAEQDRWFLWLPVLIGSGIGAYFALPVEPPWPVAAGGLAISIGLRLTLDLTRLGDRTGLRLLAAVLLTVALGFAAAQIRTVTVAAPVLVRPTGATLLKGWIEEVEQRGNRTYRIVVRVHSIEKLDGEVPRRVRVRIQGSVPILV